VCTLAVHTSRFRCSYHAEYCRHQPQVRYSVQERDLPYSIQDLPAGAGFEFIVENKLGLSAVAIFGAVVYFRSIGAQVINPMGAVIAPRLANYFSEGKYGDFMNLLKRTTFSAFLLGIGGILVALLFGKWILPLLYTAEYAAYTDLLVLVMVYCLATYMYVFIGTALTCLRVHWIKMPIHLIAFGVLAALMFFRADTLNAVVINMIIGETVMFLLYTISFWVLFNKIKGNGYAPKSLFKNIV
jgi:O-antigen/teichoic acid export membrane protein